VKTSVSEVPNNCVILFNIDTEILKCFSTVDWAVYSIPSFQQHLHLKVFLETLGTSDEPR